MLRVRARVAGALSESSVLVTTSLVHLTNDACFALLFLNNVLLFADLVVVPSVDLSLYRGLTQLAGGSLLLFGLIWDVR